MDMQQDLGLKKMPGREQSSAAPPAQARANTQSRTQTLGQAQTQVKVRVKVNLAKSSGQGRALRKIASPTTPRSVQLLALAHHFQHLLHTGQAKDLADIARLGGISRARATQIANLAFLAPSIQEHVLLNERYEDKIIGEHALRNLAGMVDWVEQEKVYKL